MIKAKQAFSELVIQEVMVSRQQSYYFAFDFSKFFIVFAVCQTYFLEIGPVHQKVWSFKCMMLKTFGFKFSQVRRHLKGAGGPADLKISKSALFSLNHHNFSNTELIYTK